MTSPEAIDWSRLIKSGSRIFIGSTAAVPNALIQNLIDNNRGLHDIEVVHILTMSDHEWVKKEHSDLFKINTFFMGPEVRQAVAEGYADYTPAYLSEIPTLFKDKILPLDVALIMVSPPDEFGYCSLGVSVDVVSGAARYARKVVAQVNPLMPRTNGHSFIHVNDIHAWMTEEQILPELVLHNDNDPVAKKIGHYVSMLVEDGCTLQLGIGKIPNAVARYLNHHKDLGIHTEMLSDEIMHLINSGVVTNRKKTFHRGKTIASLCIGSKKLYDFINSNPHVEFYPSEHVNSPLNIAKNDKMVSINSAIEVDLTGQVVADSIGYYFYSGIGGQVDFIRGAAMSKGGKPIIALPATAKNGTLSRIVANITKGGGVVTSRGDVHYVVTEYGIASLRGKSMRERVLEMISIAHPDFRDDLLQEVRKHYWVPGYQTQKPMPVIEFGPIEWKTLKVGNLRCYLRPLHPADERVLQEFFYSHSKETLLMRYSHNPKQMSRERASSLVAVDQNKDLALCVVKMNGPREEIIAVGRYYYIERENSAEVAFVVREEDQGKGIATTLLKEMIKIALKRNLSVLYANVRAENNAMRRVFEKNNFVCVPGDTPQEIILELNLKTDAVSLK
ncbi:MAG: GNAT family N-acetyltransferase [Gammaproteobacteria bacterium]|nr:GNAT family N-acetyltransferase [Gammaproteobacteria bacterium]